MTAASAPGGRNADADQTAPAISVVIPVKNGGSDLARCLDGIRTQDIADAVEVVVVDSGSTDASVATAHARDAVVHEIPAHQFSHGASRNLGAAWPAASTWSSSARMPIR